MQRRHAASRRQARAARTKSESCRLPAGFRDTESTIQGRLPEDRGQIVSGEIWHHVCSHRYAAFAISEGCCAHADREPVPGIDHRDCDREIRQGLLAELAPGLLVDLVGAWVVEILVSDSAQARAASRDRNTGSTRATHRADTVAWVFRRACAPLPYACAGSRRSG